MEHYHVYQTPLMTSHRDGIFRRTRWGVINRDGSHGEFVSIWFFHRLQVYRGTAKCDGTESHKSGMIDMTDDPKELKAFRWRSKGPGELKWDNMGGS